MNKGGFKPTVMWLRSMVSHGQEHQHIQLCCSSNPVPLLLGGELFSWCSSSSPFLPFKRITMKLFCVIFTLSHVYPVYMQQHISSYFNRKYINIIKIQFLYSIFFPIFSINGHRKLLFLCPVYPKALTTLGTLTPEWVENEASVLFPLWA